MFPWFFLYAGIWKSKQNREVSQLDKNAPLSIFSFATYKSHCKNSTKVRIGTGSF